MPFGLASAVLQFNRVPEHQVAFERRWLGIPSTHFFDDFKATAPLAVAQTVWRGLQLSEGTLGWLFDIDKDSLPAAEGRFLGFEEDYTRVAPDRVITIMPTEEFHTNVVDQLDLAASQRFLLPGDARSLNGKLLHLAVAHPGSGTRPDVRIASARSVQHWPC